MNKTFRAHSFPKFSQNFLKIAAKFSPNFWETLWKILLDYFLIGRMIDKLSHCYKSLKNDIIFFFLHKWSKFQVTLTNWIPVRSPIWADCINPYQIWLTNLSPLRNSSLAKHVGSSTEIATIKWYALFSSIE